MGGIGKLVTLLLLASPIALTVGQLKLLTAVTSLASPALTARHEKLVKSQIAWNSDGKVAYSPENDASKRRQNVRVYREIREVAYRLKAAEVKYIDELPEPEQKGFWNEVGVDTKRTSSNSAEEFDFQT
ncbi:hypothetical protein DPMN_035957 [Dreissena polymorpha]|uniref:Uncharacterized protein n=1 Tax=Dreissena polymorpha TaxID=45954 RepID=A0A9D4M8K5_DREPO|nr:hypothetical protein DPMN_035957 [Dreissena polymorpha]